MTARVSSLAPAARRRMTQAPPPDPVTAYALDVVAGRVVAGQLVRKACERHLSDLASGHERGLRWDPVEAQRAIDFFPLLRHYKGEWGKADGGRGAPITLEPWEQFIVGAAFGWRRADGSRRFRRLYVEVAKKNGKTLLAAGIALLLAFFDGEPGAEVYSAATKRDQAKLVWADACMMVRRNPSLSARLEVNASAIVDTDTASKFQPLGRDAGDSDQGINPHGAVIDELHVHADREVLDNIDSATSSRAQPLVVIITTAGVKRQSVWAEERADAVAIVEGRATDDSVLALIYTLDEGDDPFDEAVWPKANPNLGVSVRLDNLREQAEKAKRSPGSLAAFLRFRMNVPTQQAVKAIDIDAWDLGSAEPVLVPGQAVYGGLDLASVQDLAALLLVGRGEDGYYDVVCRFYCPEAGIERRSRVDGVPYADWVRDGYLVATPGNVTDYDYIREDAKALAADYQLKELAYDKWNATQLVTQLEADGATCISIPQTHAGLGPGWRELERLVILGHLRHGGHPILRWMAGNVEVETDAAGNQKPSKARSTERIDGIVALNMAMTRWIVHVAEPEIIPMPAAFL